MGGWAEPSKIEAGVEIWVEACTFGSNLLATQFNSAFIYLFHIVAKTIAAIPFTPGHEAVGEVCILA